MLKKLTSLIVLIVFILFEFCGVYSYALTPYEGTVENPVLQEATINSITLVPFEGYEYSKDGIIWQNSNVFNNLTVATTYELYQRVKATDEIDKSQKSDALEVTTKKYENNENPLSPNLNSRTDTTITLDGFEGYEYSIDGVNFQDNTTFTNLIPNTKYTFYQRIKETSDTYASRVSNPENIYTLKKNNTTEPEEIQTEEITATSITLVDIEGYEYSIDGTNFQDNNVFDGLAPNTEYTFYQRTKETDEYLAGSISNKTIKTIKYTNNNSVDAPILESYTANDVTLKKIDILEYSKDQENWQDSNVFTDLSPETEYTFYQRIKETNDTYASSISEGLNVKTKKENTNVPVNPEIESIVENIVTLKNIDGYEYSADDGLTWQDSNVLKLEPLKEYNIIQRIKSNEEYGYSIISESVLAETKQILSLENIPEGYTIFNEEDIMYSHYSNIILMEDVTLSEQYYTYPIYSNYYTLEGNGHTIRISNKFINKNYGRIRNLTIEIDMSHYNSQENFQSFGSVPCENYGLIENCNHKGELYFSDLKFNSIGGIVEHNYSEGIVKNCINYGKISYTSNADLAGIVSENDGIIENCSNIGGLYNLYTKGEIGGICAVNKGKIINCYNEGVIQSYHTKGGICGEMYDTGTIERCYNAGNIYYGNYCGGIIGINNGLVKNCYSVGFVQATNYRGGLVGDNLGGKIQTSYCVDPFGLETYPISSGFENGEKEYCYYLKQKNVEYNFPGLFGLTYSEMQHKESYDGFDFENVWQIDSDSDYYFPTLRGIKNKAITPKNVEIETITPNSIIIKKIDGYEYRINDNNYQDSNVFENLSSSTEYTIYQRVKKTNEWDISSDITVKTLSYIGDVNEDGKVNITDVALINAHVKKTKLLTGEELARADINGDGKVNITDVALVNAHVKKVKLLF